MKTILLKSCALLCFTLLVSSCKNEAKIPTNPDGFTLNGTVKGLDSGKLIFTYTRDNSRVRDTIVVSDGTFSHQGIIAYPQNAYLGIDGVDEYPFPFFIENSVITINLNKDDLENGEVSGSKSHLEYENFMNLTDKPYSDKLEALNKQYDETTDEKIKEELKEKILTLYTKMEESTIKFIKGNTNSFVAAGAILRTYGYNPDVEELQVVYDALGEDIKTSKAGDNILDILQKAKATDIGEKAIDIAMTDIDGNISTLSSLKGNYVLLDFWASWCGPCRAENPSVKKAYDAYHKKGFEIYAVSIDTKKENWLKAIEEDGLPWIHVSDLAQSNIAAKAYGIKGIPMNYLLDKEGVIIAKGLRGESLIEELEKVVK